MATFVDIKTPLNGGVSKPVPTTPLKTKLQNAYNFLMNAPGDEEDKPEDLPPVSVSQLLCHNSTEDHLILLAAILVSILLGAGTFSWTYLFVHVADIFNTYAISSHKNAHAENELRSEIQSTCLTFFGLALVFFVLGYARVYLWTQVSERTVRNIKQKFYASVLSQSISWHDFYPSGELVTVLTNEIGAIQEGLSDICGQMIEGFAGFFIGIVFALVVAFKYSVVLLIFLSVIIISSTIAYNVAAKVMLKMQDSRAKAGNVVNETISAIKTVKAFNGESLAVKKYGHNLQKMQKFGITRGVLSGLEIGFSSLYFNLIYSFGLYYGLKYVQGGSSSYSGVAILQSLLMLLLGAETFGDQLEILPEVSGALVSAAKVFDIIDRSASKNARNAKKDFPQNLDKISFKNIDFSYPSRHEVKVLKNVTFDVDTGTMVALVGHSGSGKTTIMSLLNQLYRPNNGLITINGIPIAHYKSLANEIGVVSQEPVLFGASVYENICWGAKLGERTPTLSQVIEVCKQANIHDTIMELPDKYDTFVGEGGSLFSGGEKQRIAIARCLIRNPRIMILDEATSALDSKSEALVQAAIEKCIYSNTTQRTTCIVIAHRLSTIVRSDKIVVLDAGRVVETGTHASLSKKKDGLYAQLVQAQSVSEFHSSSTTSSDSISSGATTSVQEETRESQCNVASSVKATHPWVLFRVFRHTRPNIAAIGGALLSSVINGAFLPIFAAATATIATVFSKSSSNITEEDEAKIYHWILLFLLMGIADFFIPLVRRTLYAIVGEQVAYKMRIDTFSSLLSQPLCYFDKQSNSTGAISARMDSESDSIKRVVGGPQMGLLVQALGGFGIAMVFSIFDVWQIALLSIALVPLLSIGVFWELVAIDNLVDDTKDAHEQSCQLAAEVLSNIRQ